MTEPKVSERMEALLLEVVMDGRAHERNGDRYTLADYEESKASLLSAIAEIEQRLEKWKEVAVAYQKWRDAYFKWEPDELVEHPQVHLDLEAAQDRLEAATAALGDEWDEAVKKGG